MFTAAQLDAAFRAGREAGKPPKPVLAGASIDLKYFPARNAGYHAANEAQGPFSRRFQREKQESEPEEEEKKRFVTEEDLPFLILPDPELTRPACNPLSGSANPLPGSAMPTMGQQVNCVGAKRSGALAARRDVLFTTR